MRTELGGALADLLNENGKGSGDNEMGYVERTLGFRTWILDDRDLRLNSEGFNEYTRICTPIVGSRLKSLCHINLDGNRNCEFQMKLYMRVLIKIRGLLIMRRSRNPILFARTASGICGNSSSLGNSQNGAGEHRLVAVILEILMRWCGPAPVKMQRKRKCEEPSIPSEEDGTVESRFRERGMKLVKKAGICTADR
ncbi:hypothetical protein RHSIM_Rhsim03G0026500 [Rhododendron simsii]|uniref:Uncharacterized protein n=1 Tax=Rhododendron simsii TaxID=118357 RepID=A0A834LSM8_RHOSS|nr:hypothetical protein RHSIM_Rhsim03G0026500 [Rhododendron simsii]